MKTCIWCRETELNKTFLNDAHTFPKSLGGQNICKNVCDPCNTYFGTAQMGQPKIEGVFKEFLNLSKHILLSESGKYPKNQRYKSEYFNINKQNQITTKPRFLLHKRFEEEFTIQFKKGMFKVFLEERERLRGDAFNERYNFIREFARYNLLDYPIFWIKPKFEGAIFFQIDDVLHPQFRFTPNSDFLDDQFRVFQYSLMGHQFVIPTSKDLFLLDKFKKYLQTEENGVFGEMLIEIKKFTDVNFLHLLK